MTGKHESGGGRLFNSPLLEALSRTHIAVPLTVFSIVSLSSLWLGHRLSGMGLAELLLTAVAGMFTFTLVEYTVHRWVYHMAPRTPRRARLQFILHGVHHAHPRDKQRLALPPLLSVIVAALFMGLFRATLGVHGWPFGAGFLAGYAVYLLIHYSIHAYRPPRGLLRALWKHHNLHHFASDQRAFGVSSPLWDLIMGTMPEEPAQRKARQAY
jgi:sterol desaturase/sphingolipid hydroxylase (fatty acid hydroxylase superfamily)